MNDYSDIPHAPKEDEVLQLAVERGLLTAEQVTMIQEEAAKTPAPASHARATGPKL